MQVFNEASMAFQTKTVANGGLGQETYLPEGERVCVMSVQQHLTAIRSQHEDITPAVVGSPMWFARLVHVMSADSRVAVKPSGWRAHRCHALQILQCGCRNKGGAACHNDGHGSEGGGDGAVRVCQRGAAGNQYAPQTGIT